MRDAKVTALESVGTKYVKQNDLGSSENTVHCCGFEVHLYNNGVGANCIRMCSTLSQIHTIPGTMK